MLHATANSNQLWDVPVFATSALVVATAVYVRGFRLARRTRKSELPIWRMWMFIAGIFVLFLALASPVDTFADDLLLAHMTQHLLLMCVVPPLITLGAPVVPMLRGLPRVFVVHALGPSLRCSGFVRFWRVVRTPAIGWFAMNIAYLGWHIPAAYELALRSEAWHNVEHLCFLLTSLLFWWNVIEPWPNRRTLPRWAMLPYLLTADVVNTAVSAYLCFAGRVLYPSYGVERGILGLSPTADQAAAGAEMWVIGSLAFLIPVAIITYGLTLHAGIPERATP